MTGIEHVTLLLQDLDDMETVRSLHDLGHHARLERHGCIREYRPEYRLRSHSELTAPSCTARVLGIDTCKCRELLSVDDTLTDGKETLLYRKISSLAVRIDADLAELVLYRNHRKVLDISLINILLDIIWSELRYLRCDLLLHLLGQGLVLDILSPLLTELVYRLSELLFHGILAAEIGLEHVHPVGKFAFHHFIVHSQRVHPRLHKEEL